MGYLSVEKGPHHKSAFPAKAGTHRSVARTEEKWVPAFAGNAGEGRVAHRDQCRKPCGINAERPCRIRPFWPSFCIFFIMPAMSWYCFRRRLTSGTEVPDPDAMRRRREPLRSFGLRRSALVIEPMIASWRLMMLSSMLASA